ncbi:MAG: YitT family protein [Clostridia bacterium]|nr:YitT family protein [Clostridia bacterium]
MSKGTVGKFILECLFIVLLGVVDSFNYSLLIIGNFVPMGINGIAVIINYIFGIESGWFSWFSLIANLPLCLLTFFLVDKGFAIKSFIYVVVLSLGVRVLQLFGLHNYAYHNSNSLIPVLISAVISGVIYGAVFKRNASTGGMDVVGKLVAYKRPELNFIWVSFAFSTIVAIAGWIVMQDLEQAFLCVIFVFVASFIGNTMLKGTRSALKVEVVTTHAREISDKIINDLHHTATVTRAEGMYHHTEYDLLICVINKRQLIELEKILKEYPDTFAYISQVTETVGLFNRAK